MTSTATDPPTEPAPGVVRAAARRLGRLDATMIVIGSMIGSGIFITSAESSRLVGAPGWLLAAWLLSGLMTVCGAISAAEIASMMPRVGGQYVFLRETYGRPVGFLFGWSNFMVVQTGTIAAVAVAFSKFLGVFAPWVSDKNYVLAPLHLATTGYGLSVTTQQMTALVLIAGLTWTNTRGLDIGAWIQNTFTAAKTAALIGLIVVGCVLGRRPDAAAWASSWWDGAANGWTAAGAQSGLPSWGVLALAMLLGKAMIGPLFSQSAWNNVTFTSGETRDPERTLPFAMITGSAIVVALYVLANIAYATTLSFDEIQHAPADRVGTALMLKTLGPYGASAMAAAILISTFGCVNGLILAGARVSYAMARDGLFFAPAARLNSRAVPAFALLAQGFWACLLTLPVTVAADAVAGSFKYGNLYNQLLEYIIPADLSFYCLMVGATLILRVRRPDLPRPFRAWLFPLPALIYIGLAGLLILDFVVLAPATSGIGCALVLAGVPVYWAWSRFGGRSGASVADR